MYELRGLEQDLVNVKTAWENLDVRTCRKRCISTSNLMDVGRQFVGRAEPCVEYTTPNLLYLQSGTSRVMKIQPPTEEVS